MVDPTRPDPVCDPNGGGKAVALDPTQLEEYVRFARAIPHLLPGVVAQVVRLDDPAVCVDPLRGALPPTARAVGFPPHTLLR